MIRGLPFQLPLQRLKSSFDSFPYQPALAVGDRIDLLERRRHDPDIELGRAAGARFGGTDAAGAGSRLRKRAASVTALTCSIGGFGLSESGLGAKALRSTSPSPSSKTLNRLLAIIPPPPRALRVQLSSGNGRLRP